MHTIVEAKNNIDIVPVVRLRVPCTGVIYRRWYISK